jgi:hypothetical protein
MSKKKSFVELCVAGKALPEEIDDYVERWHNRPQGSLHDYLGMRESEYARWVRDPDVLAAIIKAHREEFSLKS